MDTACQTPNVELICSAGERGVKAEGRAGRPLWRRSLGILSQLRAGRANRVVCQARLGSRMGFKSVQSPGLHRDMLCLTLEGSELLDRIEYH